MKKKLPAGPIIAPEILALAKKSVDAERPLPSKRCVVCAAVCTAATGPNPVDEDLCWVCRRLKISAWRDSDQQVAAQE